MYMHVYIYIYIKNSPLQHHRHGSLPVRAPQPHRIPGGVGKGGATLGQVQLNLQHPARVPLIRVGPMVPVALLRGEVPSGLHLLFIVLFYYMYVWMNGLVSRFVFVCGGFERLNIHVTCTFNIYLKIKIKNKK